MNLDGMTPVVYYAGSGPRRPLRMFTGRTVRVAMQGNLLNRPARRSSSLFTHVTTQPQHPAGVRGGASNLLGPEPGRETTVGSPCVATGRGAMTRVPSTLETS